MANLDQLRHIPRYVPIDIRERAAANLPFNGLAGTTGINSNRPIRYTHFPNHPNQNIGGRKTMGPGNYIVDLYDIIEGAIANGWIDVAPPGGTDPEPLDCDAVKDCLETPRIVKEGDNTYVVTFMDGTQETIDLCGADCYLTEETNTLLSIVPDGNIYTVTYLNEEGNNPQFTIDTGGATVVNNNDGTITIGGTLIDICAIIENCDIEAGSEVEVEFKDGPLPCSQRKIDITIDGVLQGTFLEGTPLIVNAFDSLSTGQALGGATSIKFRGENDEADLGSGLNQLLPTVAQRVFQEQSNIDCEATIKTIIENHNTSTRVNPYIGNDSTGVICRKDKPFQTIPAAIAALRAAGLLTLIIGERGYAELELDPGLYDGNDIVLQNAEYLTITGDHNVRLSHRIITSPSCFLHIEGRIDWNVVGKHCLFNNQSDCRIEVDRMSSNDFLYTYNTSNGGGKLYLEVDEIIGSIATSDNGDPLTDSKAEAYIYCKSAKPSTDSTGQSVTTNSIFYANENTEMYVDVLKCLNSTGFTNQGLSGNCFKAGKGAKMYIRTNESTSFGSPCISVTTDAGFTEPSEIHLISGRYVSNASDKGTIFITNTDSTSAATSQAFVHAGSSIITENPGAVIESFYAEGASAVSAKQLRLYSVVSNTGGLNPSVNLVHGTSDGSPNVI